MTKGFGDEIMMLEGLTGSHSRKPLSDVDMLSAIADFPRKFSEHLLSGQNKAEDGLNDVIGVSDLGRRPRRHRHRGRGGYGFRPTQYVAPIVTTELVHDPSALRRIRAMEQKIATLHPDKVKLLQAGIEGLSKDLVPARNSGSTVGAQMQIGAIRRAATSPTSSVAKVVANKLGSKAQELDKLAKDRRDLANKAVQDYQRDRKTVEKLERVAKNKALIVIKTAATRSDSPEVKRNMEREIKDIRKLHDRSAALGRRAVQSMKLSAVASMLSKNASGQAMLTKATKLAVEQGKPEEAKILSAGVNKHAENAKKLKSVRLQQIQKWSSNQKQDIYNRLAARRGRFLKAITLLNEKSKNAGMSKEDQRAMRDAYAQLHRVEVSMLAIHGGVMPVQPEGLGEGEPVFSIDIRANDSSGRFLEDSLEATYVSHFSVKDKNKLPVAATFGATYVSKFSIANSKAAPQGKWLERAVLAWFGDAGDLVDDTKSGVEGVFDPLIKSSKIMKRGIGKAVMNTLSNPSGISSGSINPLKLIGSADWELLRKAPSNTLRVMEMALAGKSKGVGNEMKRQAQSVYRYAKSASNSVCSMLSDTSIAKISEATAISVPGINQSAAATKYMNKVCGKAGGASKAANSLGEEPFFNIYEPVRARTFGALPGGFPELYDPIRVSTFGALPGGFPNIYDPVRTSTFALDSIEGAAIAAPVLLT
jgi:hypothetical protein